MEAGCLSLDNDPMISANTFDDPNDNNQFQEDLINKLAVAG